MTAERDALKAEIAWRQEAHDTLLKTASEIQAERNALKADHAPHYCAADHAPIRHWESGDPEELACPACRITNGHELLQAEVAKAYANAAYHADSAQKLKAEVERLTAERIGLIGEVGAASTRANRAEAEVERMHKQSNETFGVGLDLASENERLREALRDIASVSVVEVHYGREMLGVRTNNGMALVSIEEATAAALRSAKEGEVQS